MRHVQTNAELEAFHRAGGGLRLAALAAEVEAGLFARNPQGAGRYAGASPSDLTNATAQPEAPSETFRRDCARLWRHDR
jgi:hypothetical protein